MKNSIFKISAFAAISLITFITLSACEDAADGAQGVAGAQGEQGEPGESCTAKKLKDGSGYELKCGGETVGTVLNGENGEPGEPGEPGASCTVTDTTYTDENEVARTGYKLLCADTLKGVVWNGIDGENGASALELSGYDDMDELLESLKGEPGTNCTVTDTTDENDDTHTGYKLLCGSTLKGVVWNGEKGDKGDPADLTLEYYNKLLLGQKGTGFSWKYGTDGITATINGNSQVWYHFTDRDQNGGTTALDLDDDNIYESYQFKTYTSTEMQRKQGIWGKVKYGAHPGDEYGWAKVAIYWGDEIDISSWLGICLEYKSSTNANIGINYNNAEINNYGRPAYDIPVVDDLTVINIPWAKLKMENWSASQDARIIKIIQKATGIEYTASGLSGSTGEFLITKIGAYGTCE